MINDFYLECGIAQKRIHVIKVNDIRNQGYSKMQDHIKTQAKSAEKIKNVGDYSPSDKEIEDNVIRSVSEGTNYVASHWSKQHRSTVREKFKVEGQGDSKYSYDPAIKAWLESKKIPPSGHSIAILWSRFSGKKGDIHLGMIRVIKG